MYATYTANHNCWIEAEKLAPIFGCLGRVEPVAQPATTANGGGRFLFCRLVEVHVVAEQEVEQLRFQASVLGAVGQPVIATDLEGKVLYWNRAAEETYGWSSEEALGRSLKDLTVCEESLEKVE